MPKWMIALIAVSICGAMFFGVLFLYGISVYNQEAQLRNRIVAKQKDNNSEYDNLWKKISQVAQVTDAQKQALVEIIIGNSKARATSGGTLVTAVREAVPNVDTSTFNNLMNIIASSRDAWTMRQKELLDMNREHDNLIDTAPGSVVLSLLGKKKIDVTIVTSGRTTQVFKTGEDDDVNVFPQHQPEK